ncbi:hypothetical protein [Actinoalloteichus caeruleus]|uniref:hypothetical protein n=1 Tax=Actinoalloteichus cyanogriseus TaxID=2893586 RepID=UPI003BB9016E
MDLANSAIPSAQQNTATGRGVKPARRRTAAVAALTTTLAGAATFLAAPAAHAALTTHCVGTAGAVTVPNNLVVPAGESCDLTGTVINGDVTVFEGSDLLLQDVTINGSVTVRENGFLDAAGSSVSGSVTLANAFGTYAYDSELSGATATDSGFFYSFDSDITGDVATQNSEVLVESSWVEGSLSSEGSLLTDVYDSVVTGDFRVSGAEQGSVLCSTEVDGDAAFVGNSQILQVGAAQPYGGCGTNVFGGGLSFEGNSADGYVSNNIVRGDLSCTDNDPAPRGTDNRVRGESLGQCTELAPVQASARTMTLATQSRDADITERIETRSAEGAQAAQEAGPANIGS